MSSGPILSGHKVLVPGGTGAVGEGIVRQYLAAGAEVVVPTRTPERAAEFRRVLGAAATSHLHLVVHDYTTFAGAEDLAAQTEGRLGGIDDVVAAIGGFWAGRRLWEVDEADWQGAFVQLATTHLAVLRACLPRLSPGHRGQPRAGPDVRPGTGPPRRGQGLRGRPPPAGRHRRRVTPAGLDITDPEQVAAAARQCPGVSLLVNDAGVMQASTFLDAPSLDAARLEMETNYFGTLAMCRAFAPVLGANRGGALVNMLSVSSFYTNPFEASYSASKAAALAART